jgi:2-phosphosulfolactate phosphatase
MTKIEVLFSPAEFEALHRRDLSRTTCVVFDILRATSTIVTALANGAASVLPASSIEEAVAEKHKDAAVLLAGERDGFRITSKLTGSLDFDYGNSPREFQNAAVRGKRIVITTTNGTRALRACRGARKILVGSFLNLSRTANHFLDSKTEELLLICSGTYEEASFEDLLGAGAMAELVWDQFRDAHIADSAEIARNIYLEMKKNLLAAMRFARNGRRLLGIPELKEDVPFCLQQDFFPILAQVAADGAIV